MADRTLTWYFANGVEAGTNIDIAYVLDADYESLMCRIRAKTPVTGTDEQKRPTGAAFVIDINQQDILDTVTSIFPDLKPTLSEGEDELDYEFQSSSLYAGDRITIDVDTAAAGLTGITVSLELTRS